MVGQGLVAGAAGLNIDLDITFLVQLAFFLGLWVFLSGSLFRPYLAARREREAMTDGARGEATQIRAEANEAIAAYQAKIAEARAEASRLRAELVTSGSAEATVVLADARSASNKELASARVGLEKELSAARKDVEPEAKRLSAALAERILA